ncbi:MAG TPA: lysophospholipid acyltransferase family protein [Pyrinomonadaceae bacterium]|nr:lysophospholipid acyltransferase family protein [Pyrinomonadaceae bacterium]
MSTSVKRLRIPDLIFNRRGTFTFRLILFVFGAALKLFFRRIETVNADTVPRGTGVIFVMNHPNGLVDPALVFVALPRRISFLAKSTLFKMPVISFLLKTVEALPVYRKMDAGADVSKNQETFRAAEERLRNGGSIALFPEGVSHNSPKLLPLKTGAARIALGAVSVGDEPIDLRIVPVGLYYTNKTTFRSEVLLHFGDAFRVERIAPDANGQPPKEAVKALTAQIETAIREVTINAETEAEIHTASIAERIFAAASEENENLGEKLDFKKQYVENPNLTEKLAKFDAKLNAAGLEPEHLSLANLSQGFVVRQAIFQTWALMMLLPLTVFGTILHFPAYQLIRLTAYLFSRHDADDIASTVKVLAGIVYFPLTWLIAASILYFLSGSWILALASIPFSFAAGYITLYSWEEATEMSGWAKAIWTFLTDKDNFLRLYVERRELTASLETFDR